MKSRFYFKSSSRGMTLVELMVAVAITLVISTLSITIFMAQHKSYVNQRESMEAQETLPAVAEIVKRDILESGWSVLPSMSFYFVDGGAGGTDEIYVNDSNVIDLAANCSLYGTAAACNVVNGCLWNVSKSRCDFEDLIRLVSVMQGTEVAGGTGITSGGGTSSIGISDLDLDGDGTNDLVVGGFAITDDNNEKVALITGVGGGPTLTTDQDLDGNYVAPAVGYDIKDISGTLVLRRTDRDYPRDAGDPQEGGLPVADNLVDLQVAYLDNTDTWNCSAPSDPCPSPMTLAVTNVRKIRVTMVMKGDRLDHQRKNEASSCRPPVANHSTVVVGGATCGYNYHIHTFEITPKRLRQ